MKRRSLAELDDVIDEIVSHSDISQLTMVIEASMARAVEKEYGERCPDFDEDCVVCKAWRDFDKWKKS